MGKKIFVYGGGVAIILFVLLFAGAGAILLYSEQRTIGEYFDSNGVQIHYTKEGEGVPVILVHGFAFNSDLQWRQPGIHDALLKDGYQVITFDCRGNGLSEKPHEREAYGEEMPNDIFRLMDHLKIEKAHIVGYSMGGFITLKFIEMHPERILSAAPCGITWHPVEEKDLEFTRRLATALEEDGDFSPLFERLNMPIPSGIGMKVARWVAQRSNDTKALASIMWEFPKFEVKEDAMKKNTVPTLTIVGDEDPLSEYGEIMHNAMQNHELVIVPGGNHMTTTRDDKFLDALLPFLKKNTPASEVKAEEINVKEAA